MGIWPNEYLLLVWANIAKITIYFSSQVALGAAIDHHVTWFTITLEGAS